MIDQQQRQQALDPHHSFIVQAPAGSGKTEILTQRFLVLLTKVQEPEEIIAITFTRKAASEMRQRIMLALENAKKPAPSSAHAKKTWELANQVLIHGKNLAWDICENPNRLRIQTIDSLCANLTRQMPLLSKFGCEPCVTENATPLYLQAVRNVLLNLESDGAFSDALCYLLFHLDNNVDVVERLMMDVLTKREQWLPHVIDAKYKNELRGYFEKNLQQIIEQSLQFITETIPKHLINEIVELSALAANYLDSQKSTSEIIACFGLEKLPNNHFESLSLWLGIAELLLTKTEGSWRKQVNKLQGFPAASDFKNSDEKDFYKKIKQRMEQCLQELKECEVFRIHLHNLRQCPPAFYNDQQWQCVEALLTILPLLVAELKLVFRAEGLVDFSEISQQAIVALGTSASPTDLAMALDYRIQHLLIDEFQDTSLNQFRLIEKLTENWQKGDGRTLFLVGDPMQSIYRFRAAEVGLFLKCQQQGLGQLKLQALTLCANFRSQGGLVSWNNEIFSQLFPKTENISLGAVSYHYSESVIDAEPVAVKCYAHADQKSQAYQVAELIQKATGSVAILVRARSHLVEIAKQLKENGIPYQAVEIESLYDRPVIQDLWSLTRALLYPNDKLAWLSVLRAPMCGLTLQDLHRLAQPLNENILWRRITNPEVLSGLSSDARVRLNKLTNVLTPILAQIQRQSLGHLIEKAWLALGGSLCIDSASELDEAKAYFDLLEQQEQGGTLLDKQQFENNLKRLFANASKTTPRVQLMTIHKAKGLEFDTVIIPALEKSVPYDPLSILLWSERPSLKDNQLLLAPISRKSEEDALYQFLRRENNSKAQHELIRLLYVGATRAKQQLYLLSCVEQNELGELVKPRNNSLLSILWENLKSSFIYYQSNQTNISPTEIKLLKRMKSNWQSPIKIPMPVIQNNKEVDYAWTNSFNRANGILIHRQFYLLSQFSELPTAENAIQQFKSHWQAALSQLGVLPDAIFDAIAQVEMAVKNILSDQRGRWILNNVHQEAHSEYPLTAFINNELKIVQIDRTFIDEEGVRWIIDYKTSQQQTHETIENFIARETQSHLLQLQQYADILKLQDSRIIRGALYFPTSCLWLDLGVLSENKTVHQKRETHDTSTI